MRNQITEVYAKALLDLAIEDNKVNERKLAAKELIKYISDDLLSLLKADVIEKSEKHKIINECFVSFGDVFCHFLCLISDSGRSGYIRDILGHFIDKCNEYLHIKEVTLRFAHPLSEAEKDQIATALKKRLNCAIEIKEELDERLLAGVKVEFDGQVIDTSLKRRFENLRKELLNESW